MTARQIDENGFITIEANPITRSGVFPYLGRSIGAPEPDKIYYVYRPPEELADPECINSFKLLPIVDDHDMIGPSDEGLLPAEKKGTHGVVGETIEFRGNVLYATIKIFSEALANLIKQGKKDLSLGYRCVYEKATGTFAGQAYEYVQRSLRGNHLALVDQARCDVAVLDSRFTFDKLDLFEKEEKKMDKQAFDAMDDKLSKVVGAVEALTKRLDAKDEAEKAEQEKAAADKKAADEAAAAEAAKKKEGEDEDEENKEDTAKAMDSLNKSLKVAMDKIETLEKGGIKSIMGEIKSRDELANKISRHVGAFDHSEMTASEVAAYGVEKLGLKCEKGQERAALDGFFHAAQSNPMHGAGFTLDGMKKQGASEIDAYINGSK